MNEKQLKFLDQLQKNLEGGAVQPDELKEIIDFVLEVIKQVKDTLDNKIMENKGEMVASHDDLYRRLEVTESKMSDIHAKMSEKMAGDISSCIKQINQCVKDLEDLRGSMPEEVDLSDIWTKLTEIETKIPKIPDEITPYQVRDKLESIDNESEKLKIEAIQNLREELDELKKTVKINKLPTGGFNYASMSFHLIDDETPSGTINSSNTIFTLANIPSPASSLKVYLNGARQRITEDYTLSGGTITFTIAPQTGSVLLVDYRV